MAGGSAHGALWLARRILEAQRVLDRAKEIGTARDEVVARARRARADAVREAAGALPSIASTDPLRDALDRVCRAHDAWQVAAPGSDDEDRLADEYTIALLDLGRTVRGRPRRPGSAGAPRRS